ncbi:MAG: hypothetical protein ACHQ4G_02175 [Opitutales bacterium]
MHAKFFSLQRRAGVICAGAILALAWSGAAANEATPASDAFPSFDSYIKVTGQAPFITGDSAAFAQRAGTPNTGAGGIEDFYYSKDTGQDTTVKINGHALGGTEDYLGTLNFTKANLGSVEAGYKRFRTFYDGVGGFFPLADQFQTMGTQHLHVDRGAFWASATLALPDRPVFNVTFRDETRNGQKDSSEWAAIVSPIAVVTNGALVGTKAPANTPFIAPNVLTLDEHHQILEGSMVATVGKVTETLKVTGDWVNNDDYRSYVKYPGSTVLANPTVTVLDDEQVYKANTFRILSQTNLKFNDTVALDLGLNYSHTSTTNGGQWTNPSYSATLKTVYTAMYAQNIFGGAKVDDYVGNLFLHLTPKGPWSADVGVRLEDNVTGSSGGFTTTSLASTAKNTSASSFTVNNDLTYSHFVDHGYTPEVTVQYAGFANTIVYATYDKRVNNGTQHWINPYAAVSTAGVTGVVTTTGASPGSVFFQDADQNNQNFKVGANWNPTGNLTVRAELYRKDHNNQFIGSSDYVGLASTGALYVTGYTFTGVKLSVIYRVTPELSFNTRYQPQSGAMSVLANAVTGGVGNETTSGKVRGQMISETVNWNPNPTVYVQGSLNVVYNYIQTAYPAVVVSTTTYVPMPIQNSNNNYTTGTVLCGFVLDKLDDLLLQGYWMQSDNYNPGIAYGGQPYGASFKESSATVGLKHKFSDRIVGDVKLGYLDRTDDTTGGFTNYRGPLAYVALTYAL